MEETLREKRSELFRRLLVRARKDSGLTQTEVAARLGHGQAYVSKYERGRKSLGVIEFIEVADAVGFDPSEMLKKLRRSK